MNTFRIFLTLISLLSATALAQPRGNDALDCDYDSKLSSDLRIAACTRAINSGKHSRESLVEFHFHRGLAWMGKDDPDRAIADYTETIRLDPNLANGFFNRGIAWQKKNDYKNALADFGTAARLNPKDRDTFFRLGQVNFELKNFPAAISDYSEALRIGPPTAFIYASRATAKRRLTDLDAAIADLNEAIKLSPDYAWAYAERGNIWIFKKEYDKSVADYTEAMRLEPNNPDHLWWRSNAWYGKGNFTQALFDTTAVIKLNEKDWPGAYNRLAWLLATAPFSLRDGKRAVQYATKANELSHWNNPVFIDTLAAAHAEAGNFSEAIRWQMRAMEFPTYQKRNDFPEAQQRLEMYRKGLPYRMARKDVP